MSSSDCLGKEADEAKVGVIRRNTNPMSTSEESATNGQNSRIVIRLDVAQDGGVASQLNSDSLDTGQNDKSSQMPEVEDKEVGSSEPPISKGTSTPQDSSSPKNPSTPQEPSTPQNPSTPQEPSTPQNPSIPQNPSTLRGPSNPQGPSTPQGLSTSQSLSSPQCPPPADTDLADSAEASSASTSVPQVTVSCTEDTVPDRGVQTGDVTLDEEESVSPTGASITAPETCLEMQGEYDWDSEDTKLLKKEKNGAEKPWSRDFCSLNHCDHLKSLIKQLGVYSVVVIAFGIPKLIVGVHHENDCPAFPMMPIYLLASGVADILCPILSLLVCLCFFTEGFFTRDLFFLLLWVSSIILVPIGQVVGGPYVLYVYLTERDYGTPCSNSSLLLQLAYLESRHSLDHLSKRQASPLLAPRHGTPQYFLAPRPPHLGLAPDPHHLLPLGSAHFPRQPPRRGFPFGTLPLHPWLAPRQGVAQDAPPPPDPEKMPAPHQEAPGGVRATSGVITHTWPHGLQQSKGLLTLGDALASEGGHGGEEMTLLPLDCYYCHPNVMTCALVTALLELMLVAAPTMLWCGALFRHRRKLLREERERRENFDYLNSVYDDIKAKKRCQDEETKEGEVKDADDVASRTSRRKHKKKRKHRQKPSRNAPKGDVTELQST